MDNAGTFWKAVATVVVWTMVVGAIVLSSVFLGPSLGEDIIAIIFMVMAAAVVSMGFVWNWGQVEGQQKANQHQNKRTNRDDDEADLYDELLYTAGATGKRKNGDDRLSDALRSLSDDELIRLRQRLANGEITEDELAAALRDR
jgi:uncharacterized membrane protein